MSKLKRVVKIIAENTAFFEGYYNYKIYRTYNIDHINFHNINNSINDALKLFYFSLTTRQQIANNPFADDAHRDIENTIESVLNTLNDPNFTVEQRYFKSLKLLNHIRGAGQKINTMFIKFLIFHSIDLNNRNELERILWIPLDVHIMKFLFNNYNGQETLRFRIFDEEIKQQYLRLSFDGAGNPKGNRLLNFQQLIRNKFDEDEITYPPIILDNLWVIGSSRCRFVNFSQMISCQNCPFNQEYQRQPICYKENNNNLNN